MKFQLISAIIAAFFAVSITAVPASSPYDSHGLIPDADVFDGSDDFNLIEARAPESPFNKTLAENFNFTSEFSLPLDHLFTQIESIPDEVLEQGDEALHKWLVEHGYRAPDKTLKQDVDVPHENDNPTIFERDVLLARDPSWVDIARCVAAIFELLVTTAVPALKILRIKRYIAALGGARQAVKLLLGATTRAEKLKAGGQALLNLADELLGISSVMEACF